MAEGPNYPGKLLTPSVRKNEQCLPCDYCKKPLSYFPIFVMPTTTGQHNHYTGKSICGRCDLLMGGNHKGIHNAIYEKLVEQKKFPCTYKNSGCKEKLIPADMAKHEELCKHAAYDCSVLTKVDCTWEGNAQSLLRHFQKEHSPFIINEGDIINLEQGSRKFRIIKTLIENEYYGLLIIYRKNTLHLTAKVFPLNTNEKFVCHIIVKEMQGKANAPIYPKAIYYLLIRCKDANAKPNNLHIQCLIRKTSMPEEPATNNDILAKFECPICMEYMKSRIFQCVNGHSICECCRKKVRACPMCKCPMNDQRNFAMEEVAEILVYPCSFEGCTFSSTKGELKTHQAVCQYALQKCPFCNWEKAKIELYLHIQSKHADYIFNPESERILIDINDEISCNGCFVVLLRDDVFLFSYLYDGALYCGLQMFRSPVKECMLEIQIVDCTGRNQKLVLEKMLSPCKNNQEIFQQSSSYININLETLESLILSNTHLKFAVNITQIKFK